MRDAHHAQQKGVLLPPHRFARQLGSHAFDALFLQGGKNGLDAIGIKMGAHAIFNCFQGPVGEEKAERERSSHITEIAWLRMRLGAVTHKAQHLNHTVETFEVTLGMALCCTYLACPSLAPVG